MKTRAAVLWESPGLWSVEDVELAEPGPTELLVELVAAGLCHSDDHFAKGDLHGRLPAIGGHEGAGVVRAVGSEVRGFAVGDHVLTSFIPACGKCRWCAEGKQNLCDAGSTIMEGTQPSGGTRVTKDGADIATMGALGTFAEWQVFDQISLIKIEKDIPLDVACLVSCGVQTGYGSATTAANVRAGDVVMVLGAGGIGMNAVQGAAASGASHVVVVDPAPFKLQQAPSFGATDTYADFDEALAFVRSVTNGQGADSVIVTIGVVHGEHIGQAFTAVRKAGTLVVTGLSPDTEQGIPVINACLLANLQIKIQGALYGMGSPREAMPKLLNMYRTNKLKLDELITRRYALDQINEGYSDMHKGVNIRGIIDFSLS